ncbi:MAG: CoA transferase, partial [Chloroflexi bacterium]|nr:CoA transferase [Chloroflexota bacterium]
GAEVVRVETIQRMGFRGALVPPAAPPPGVPRSGLGWGYADNQPGEKGYDRYAGYAGVNRNKWGITLDLLRPAGQALYKRLAAVSDVVLENYAAGVLEKLGLGYHDLCKVNPAIIVVSMPLFGNTGPYRHWRGGGFTADPVTGHVALRGYEDEDPGNVQGNLHTDAVMAPTAALAALTALYRRRRTGRGQLVDISHPEAFMPHLGEQFLDYAMNGRSGGPLGNRHPRLAPHNVYRARGDDRWLALAVRSEEEWAALGRVLGEPEWRRDPRFASAEGRKAHEDALDAHLEGWSRDQDASEAAAALQAAGVPAAPVLTHADTYADPHLAARGFFVTVSHPSIGTYRYPGFLWKLHEGESRVRIPPNRLGEHNREVLCGLLGVTDDEYATLEREQVIGDAYLPTAGR